MQIDVLADLEVVTVTALSENTVKQVIVVTESRERSTTTATCFVHVSHRKIVANVSTVDLIITLMNIEIPTGYLPMVYHILTIINNECEENEVKCEYEQARKSAN